MNPWLVAHGSTRLNGESSSKVRRNKKTKLRAPAVTANKGMQLTMLRAAADGERWGDTRSRGLRPLRLERRRVLRLINAECPAAWECKPRDRSPTLLVDGGALYLL